MSRVAKYSSPLRSLTPWQEKWSNRVSPRFPDPRNFASAISTSWQSRFSTVSTANAPTCSSWSTSARARASEAGAFSCASLGSLYSSVATISALRTPVMAAPIDKPAFPRSSPPNRGVNRLAVRESDEVLPTREEGATEAIRYTA